MSKVLAYLIAAAVATASFSALAAEDSNGGAKPAKASKSKTKTPKGSAAGKTQKKAS